MDYIWATSIPQPCFFFKHIEKRKLEEKGRIAKFSSVTQWLAAQFVHTQRLMWHPECIQFIANFVQLAF